MKLPERAIFLTAMIITFLVVSCSQKKTLTIEIDEEAVDGYKIQFEYRIVDDPSSLSEKVYYTLCRKNSLGNLELLYAGKQDIHQGDTLAEGKVTGYIELDGKKQVLSEYTLKDGEMDGMQTGYFATGEKRSEVSYKNGKKNGGSIEWNKDGEIISKIIYKDDVVTEVIKEKTPSQ